MAKTSMFGGAHLCSAELPTSPTGTRLQYKSPPNNENADPSAAIFCLSAKSSTICRSPSASNKGDQLSTTQDKCNSGAGLAMSFLERMAQQGSNPTSINANPHDPMAHTFSSLSPKHQASAIVESKNLLKLANH